MSMHTKSKIAIAIMAIVLGSWCATSIFAWQCGFHQKLGTPMVERTLRAKKLTPGGDGKMALYYPWDIWRWGWRWGWNAPEAFRGAALGWLAITGLCLIPLARGEKPQEKKLRWATREDLKKDGLIE